MTVIKTARTTLRHLCVQDAGYILELLNEPSFLRYVGDRGVRTLDDAREYIRSGPVASYAEHGFGLYLVVSDRDAVPMGICGLLKRESLDDVDIGFALSPAYWSQGYGFETAAAVLEYGRQQLGHERIVAVTSPDNAASIRLLEKLGMRYERTVRLEPEAPEIKLFSIEMGASPASP